MPRIFSLEKFSILLLISCFLFSACSAKEEEAKTKTKRQFSVPVEIGKIVRMDVKDQVRTIGYILEDKRVFISPEVEGKIIELPVKEGMHVKTDDVLARLDPVDYQLEVERLKHRLDSAAKELEKAKTGERPEELDRLEAQENAAKSGLDLALKNQNRIQKLVKEGVMALVALDTVVDEVVRAREELRARQSSREAGMQAREEDIEKLAAQMEAARKLYDQAVLDLNKTTLRAPFGGVILKKRVEQGAFVKPNDLVAEMVSHHKVVAAMTLPQSYRNRLKHLEGIEIFIRELNKKIYLDKAHSKRVQIIPDADIFSGNFEFWIDLIGKESNLFPGLTFEARLTLDTRKNVLHVPSTALVISEKGTAVYIMKDGKAHIVPVRAFKERKGFVEIEDFTRQLKPNADLILRGSGAVFPSAPVAAAKMSS